MFASILASAFIGAVAGGVGGLLGAILEKVFKRESVAGKRNLGAVVGVVLGITIANQTGLRDQLARAIDPPSAMDRFGEEIVSIPGVKQRISGKSPQEARAVTQNLAAAGMLKLDDSSLVRRAQLVSQMLTKTDEQLCEAFATRKISDEDFMRMMSALSDEQRESWFSLIRAAVAAEVGANPVLPQRAPTPDQIAAAIAEIEKPMPKIDQDRFGTNLGALATLPSPEACWTIRSLYSGVCHSTGLTQSTLARALLMP